jgi:hypothetical protein
MITKVKKKLKRVKYFTRLSLLDFVTIFFFIYFGSVQLKLYVCTCIKKKYLFNIKSSIKNFEN